MLRAIRNLVIVALLGSAFPWFSEITTCRCCLWTTRFTNCREWDSATGGYYSVKTKYGYPSIGLNQAGIGPHEDHKWHRVRLGFPLKSITVDFREGSREWHLVFEDWFWVNLASLVALWGLFECFAYELRSRKSANATTNVNGSV